MFFPFLGEKALPEAQLELGARRKGMNCGSHSCLTQAHTLVLGTDLKKMAGKREPPEDPLEVSWMGGFMGMDGDTSLAQSSAVSTSKP